MTPKHLIWRCRRGNRELDMLLTGYLEQHYSTASPSEQAAFQRLLELPDALLWRHLCQGLIHGDADLDALVHQIRHTAAPDHRALGQP